jgi:hypothetical protein
MYVCIYIHKFICMHMHVYLHTHILWIHSWYDTVYWIYLQTYMGVLLFLLQNLLKVCQHLLWWCCINALMRRLALMPPRASLQDEWSNLCCYWGVGYYDTSSCGCTIS